MSKKNKGGIEHHSQNCQCFYCKGKRGELKGKNSPNYVDEVKWICPECKIVKYLKPGEAKKRKFCSYHCANTGKNHPRGMLGKKQKAESIEKIRKGNIGENNPMFKIGNRHPRWKGEKFQTKEGYWSIWINGKRTSQARYIAEQCLNRKLTTKEVVHHINEDKLDDKPENLYVFPSQSKHTIHHKLKITPILVSNILRTF